MNATSTFPGNATSSETLLDRMTSLDALRWAWHRVRANKGKAGHDGVTLGRFGRLLDANLLALAVEVHTGAYRPGRYRLLHLRIGKKVRQISILSVRDRVLQRAALDVLTPLLDATFLPCSFAYRPLRSLQQAVERIVRLRDRGLWWVVDADITNCFGSLDHDLLTSFVEPLIPDPAVRHLLSMWMAMSSVEGGAANERGIPLGAVVSPLFCNIYLHQLDRALRRRRLQIVRYADDFVVLCKSREHAQWALRAIEKVLGGLKLELHPGKTRLVSFDEGFDFLGVRFQGTDYSYFSDGKRVIVDNLPPTNFYYYADGYE